jgi:hypothetical protein
MGIEGSMDRPVEGRDHDPPPIDWRQYEDFASLLRPCEIVPPPLDPVFTPSEGRDEGESSWDDLRVAFGSVSTDIVPPRVKDAAVMVVEAMNMPDRRALVLLAAQALAGELDAAEPIMPPRPLETARDALADLGLKLDSDLGRTKIASRPIWLHVAPPAHGMVAVAGVSSLFRTGHQQVMIDNSESVVTANDCTLDAVDHYHVRRVSLDCNGLYDDEKAFEAFVAVMVDPSEPNIDRLSCRLREIVEPQEAASTPGGAYRAKVAHSVETSIVGADVAALGDHSTVRSETNYHLRETVIPLATLLDRQPRLIGALAEGYGRGVPSGLIRGALDDVEGADLLRHASGLGDGRAAVTHFAGGIHVDLAAAVMVGYGNRLTTSSTVDARAAKEGNLARFNRIVRRRVDALRDQQRAMRTADVGEAFQRHRRRLPRIFNPTASEDPPPPSSLQPYLGEQDDLSPSQDPPKQDDWLDDGRMP